MKYLYIPIIILLILLAFILGRGCGVGVSEKRPPVFDSTAIWKKQIRAETEELLAAKELGKIRDSVVYKWRDRWHESKHDTIYKECKELIVICDSVVVSDSLALAAKDTTIKHQDRIISAQAKLILKADTNLAECKSELKKTKRKLFCSMVEAKTVEVLWIIREGAGVVRRD